MGTGDGGETHLPKKDCLSVLRERHNPGDSSKRIQECFTSKSGYAENQNRINIFRELGYPEKILIANN